MCFWKKCGINGKEQLFESSVNLMGKFRLRTEAMLNYLRCRSCDSWEWECNADHRLILMAYHWRWDVKVK